jgi:uncharacterized membrane protein YhaH (DUF805 family)
MGSFSIWHYVVLGWLVLPVLLPLIVRRPDGPNRFGAPEPFDGRAPDAVVASIRLAFRRVFDFNGRTARGAFWYPFGLLWVVSVIVRFGAADSGPAALVLSFVSLALLVPIVAICVRRLHDLNRSGWWVLLSFSMGWLVLLWWFAQPSEEQRRGETPAEVFS